MSSFLNISSVVMTKWDEVPAKSKSAGFFVLLFFSGICSKVDTKMWALLGS